MARTTRIQFQNILWAHIADVLYEHGVEKNNPFSIDASKRIKDNVTKSANDIVRTTTFTPQSQFAVDLGITSAGEGELLLIKLQKGDKLSYKDVQSLFEYLIINDKMTPEIETLWERANLIASEVEAERIRNEQSKLGGD